MTRWFSMFQTNEKLKLIANRVGFLGRASDGVPCPGDLPRKWHRQKPGREWGIQDGAGETVSKVVAFRSLAQPNPFWEALTCILHHRLFGLEAKWLALCAVMPVSHWPLLPPGSREVHNFLGISEEAPLTPYSSTKGRLLFSEQMWSQELYPSSSKGDRG